MKLRAIRRLFGAARRGLVQGPAAVTGTKHLLDDGTWTDVTATGIAASTAEALAGTDSAKFISPLTGNARAAVGEASRIPAAGLQFTDSGNGQSGEAPQLYGSNFFFRFRLVSPATAAAGETHIAGLYAAAGNSTNNSIRFMGGAGAISLAFYVRATTTSAIVSTGLTLAPSTAYDVLFTMVHATATWTIYLNGTQAATGTLNGDALSEYAAITGLAYVKIGNNADLSGPTPNVVLSVETGNVALSAAEVAALTRYGWAALPQYVHAGGAGVVLYSSNFGSSDGWTATGVAVTANYDSGDPGYASTLRIVAGDGSSDRASRAITAPSGKRYRFKQDYKPVVTTGNVLLSINDVSGTVVVASESFPAPASGAWATWDQTFTTTSENLLVRSYPAQLNGAAGDELLIANVTLTTLGLCGRWVFDSNTGYCVRDRSGGRNPIVLAASGVQFLAEGTDIIAVPIPVMSAGGFINGDRVIVPAGYETYAATLQRVTGSSTGTATIRKTSSGGTTLFTGTLAATVSLTPTVVAFTTADKLHLSLSDWTGTTIKGVVWARRIS